MDYYRKPINKVAIDLKLKIANGCFNIKNN